MNKFFKIIENIWKDKHACVIIIALIWALMEFTHQEIMDQFFAYLFLDLGKNLITNIVTNDYFIGQMASFAVLGIAAFLKIKNKKDK